MRTQSDSHNSHLGGLCKVAWAARAADNSGYHDARLLYIIDLASSRAHCRAPSKEARDDLIAADVIRKLANWE